MQCSPVAFQGMTAVALFLLCARVCIQLINTILWPFIWTGELLAGWMAVVDSSSDVGLAWGAIQYNCDVIMMN